MYDPASGRFTTKDSWQGDYNKPLSLNRWMYVEGNPVNYTDPSGHFPEGTSQILSRALSQYYGSPNNFNILNLLGDCLPGLGNQPPQGNQTLQRDLTGYLALAMTKHGQDSRVKEIANLISWGTSAGAGTGTAIRNLLTAYVKFYNLEASKKEWDIKVNINVNLGKNIVLCGTGINCGWFDYSTPGNIHFGYIAGLAKIDHFVSAVAGGVLEQSDLKDAADNAGVSYNPLKCFTQNAIDKCDNPQDQAAVDFGYKLSKNPKYKNGISDQELRYELQLNGMGNFQTNPHRYDEYWWQVYPEVNHYGADEFNYYK